MIFFFEGAGRLPLYSGIGLAFASGDSGLPSIHLFSHFWCSWVT